MDSQILPPFFGILTPELIPYAILVINLIIFQLLRSSVNKLFIYYMIREPTLKSNQKGHLNKQAQLELSGKCKFLKLLIDELISTCELCADCAELNVIYEKHGSFMYGLGLFILTYFWLDNFGDAHTTPGYLFEDYFLDNGNELLKRGDIYARFLGQSMAMPLAWRFASIYWSYKLLSEHSEMLKSENCKSSLSTSTLNGFLIELICCLLCRLFELFGNKLLSDNSFGKRVINLTSSFLCTILVVLALELSGGYFNPILAASLEYGCKGIDFYQHVLVFWLGPLLGHVLAKASYKRLFDDKQQQQQQQQQLQTNKKKSVAIQKSRSKSNIIINEQQKLQQLVDNLPAAKPATRSSRKKRD